MLCCPHTTTWNTAACRQHCHQPLHSTSRHSTARHIAARHTTHTVAHQSLHRTPLHATQQTSSHINPCTAHSCTPSDAHCDSSIATLDVTARLKMHVAASEPLDCAHLPLAEGSPPAAAVAGVGTTFVGGFQVMAARLLRPCPPPALAAASTGGGGEGGGKGRDSRQDTSSQARHHSSRIHA